MKHLCGKRIAVWDLNQNKHEGLCTGASDDIVKILIDGEKDERVFFVRCISSYVVIGEGVSGGYSGLKAYVCKNDAINCHGRIRISSKESYINDMGCEACKKNCNLDCDFGCIGAIEVIPSAVKRKIFDGMEVARTIVVSQKEENRK